MLPRSLIALASVSTHLSGTVTVTDSPPITLWDKGATRWIDALADIAPQSPPFQWPNLTTIKRRRTRWDGDTNTRWDGGLTEWIEARTGYTPPDTPTRWINGPDIARRGTRWDEVASTRWDGGITHFDGKKTEWDAPEGTDTRKWVIGKAGPFGANLWTADGTPHTARLWIQPPDPATNAALTRRAIVREAVRLWQTDNAAARAASGSHTPTANLSAYHRWISFYVSNH